MLMSNVHPRKRTCPPKKWTISIRNTSSNHWFSGDMSVFRGKKLQLFIQHTNLGIVFVGIPKPKVLETSSNLAVSIVERNILFQGPSFLGAIYVVKTFRRVVSQKVKLTQTSLDRFFCTSWHQRSGFNDIRLEERVTFKSIARTIWMFPNIGVPQNGWFIMESPIQMDDLGGTTIFGNIHLKNTSIAGCKAHLRPGPFHIRFRQLSPHPNTHGWCGRPSAAKRRLRVLRFEGCGRGHLMKKQVQLHSSKLT